MDSQFLCIVTGKQQITYMIMDGGDSDEDAGKERKPSGAQRSQPRRQIAGFLFCRIFAERGYQCTI